MEDIKKLKSKSLPHLKPLKINKHLKSKNSKHPKPRIQKLDVAHLIQKTININPNEGETLIVPQSKLEMALHIDEGFDDRSYGSQSVRSLPKSGLLSPSEHSYNSTAGHSLYSIPSRYSNWEISTLGSESSIQSHITSREMVEEISRRALKNRVRPDYVPSLKSIDPSLISWDRIPLKENSEDPPLNIIGCMHPLETILAKADRRLRRRAKVLKKKEEKCEEKVHQLNKIIEWKYSRAERYAAKLRHQQLQAAWLKIIIIGRYFKIMEPRYEYRIKMERAISLVSKSVIKIQRAFYGWYRRHLFKKIGFSYADAFIRLESSFKLTFKIYCKRRAVKRLVKFLIDHRNHHKMSVVIHRYLQSVKKVQRIMRDFIVCKHSKVYVLMKLWDKYEHQYIRKKLEIKKARMKDLQVAKKSKNDIFSQLNSKDLIEMKHQAKVWAKLDTKMDKIVSNLKMNGAIQEESEEDAIQKLCLPEPIKFKALITIVEALRKDHLVCERNQIKKQIEMDATFKENHALDLLRGRDENIYRIINEKFDKKLVQLKYKPFSMFSQLDRKIIWDKMREAHIQHETFKIHIDK